MAIFNGEVNVTIINTDGSVANCAELCPDCPRRTGKETETNRAPGVRGLLGKTVTTERRILDRPLTSGAINNYETDGYDGVFYGYNSGENSGTVAGLNQSTAKEFVKAVVDCDGPIERGNVCPALGRRSSQAIHQLDYSMEMATDEAINGHNPIREAGAVNLVVDNRRPLALEQ